MHAKTGFKIQITVQASVHGLYFFFVGLKLLICEQAYILVLFLITWIISKCFAAFGTCIYVCGFQLRVLIVQYMFFYKGTIYINADGSERCFLSSVVES